MVKVNTSPVSGTRDFLFLEVLRRKHVIRIIEEVYQSYGFEPLETPTMERLETLLGKYGEEGDQLIFRVMKRGEKLQKSLQEDPSENNLSNAGLRYDLTVPLARVVAEYQHQLPRIIKRYQIQPVFRADRPAKGRYREFYQCDVDIIGTDSPVAETEVIAAVVEVLRRLGFDQPGDFAVRLNHRGVLRALLEVTGIPSSLEASVLVAVDKLDRIGPEGVGEELRARGIGKETANRLLDLIDRLSGETDSLSGDLSPSASQLPGGLEESAEMKQALQVLKKILSLSEKGPAAGRLKIDPFLARGLSYYTGPIFEIEFPELQVSAGGGGRYDDLIGMFSGQAIPACGFSLGLERILLLMQEREMFPEQLQGQPQILVTQFDERTFPHSLALASQLRSHGFRVDVYPDNDRYGKQFKYADQRKIRYALLLSPNELERHVVAVKDLQSGDQLEVAEEQLTSWLRQQLQATAEEAPAAGKLPPNGKGGK